MFADTFTTFHTLLSLAAIVTGACWTGGGACWTITGGAAGAVSGGVVAGVAVPAGGGAAGGVVVVVVPDGGGALTVGAVPLLFWAEAWVAAASRAAPTRTGLNLIASPSIL